LNRIQSKRPDPVEYQLPFWNEMHLEYFNFLKNWLCALYSSVSNI